MRIRSARWWHESAPLDCARRRSPTAPAGPLRRRPRTAWLNDQSGCELHPKSLFLFLSVSLPISGHLPLAVCPSPLAFAAGCDKCRPSLVLAAGGASRESINQPKLKSTVSDRTYLRVRVLSSALGRAIVSLLRRRVLHFRLPSWRSANHERRLDDCWRASLEAAC